MYRALVIILFLIPLFTAGQIKTIGTPNIQNYPKSVYKAGTQNWDMSQDTNGFMYFANNSGILRFDGFNWELLDINIPPPVRSVYVDSDNQIYVGLIDNFGVLDLGSDGKYKFRSLRYLFDQSIGFNDVWKIHEIEQGIVFQSFEKLFIYDGESIKVHSPKERYRYSFTINGRLFLQEDELGLYQYNDGSFDKLPWIEPRLNGEIISVLEFGEDQFLLGTDKALYKYNNGILKEWDCPVNEFIKTNVLYSSTAILGNYFAFGTILNGVVISDFAGNIVQVLNRDNGLQNNTVLSLFADKDQNLWLGLDNGIDYVEINSPISFVSEGGEIGTGYCSLIHNDRLYLGTNQGLFVKSFSSFSKNEETFELIENTEGQVWSLAVYDDEIICGHNLGTYLIKNETAIKIDNEPGGWKYVRSRKDATTLIGGFYTGLAIFKKGENGWQFAKKLKGFNESCRFIVEDENGYFWISHGSKGIYRISLNEQLDSITESKFYDKTSGLPSGEENIVLVFNQKTLISTIDGIYEYNLSGDNFVRSIELNNLFGDIGRLKTLSTDKEGNLWFIGGKQSGVLRRNMDLTYTTITAPFKSLQDKYLKDFECIYPFNNDHIFFAIDDGFAHYSSKFSKSYVQEFKAFITKVELSNIDSVLNFQNISHEQNFEFSFQQNSFRFHYASPFFENISDLKFSYKLENYSNLWSEWTSDSYKDFTNLYEGEYYFKVKAKNVYGAESEVADFRFRIIPPWYRSNIAYYIYFGLLIILIFLLVKFILYRIDLAKKKEKLKHESVIRKQEEEFQYQAVIAEKEIIKLRNDKLKSDMIYRDKELVNQTNAIIQKNKFLRKLNDELKVLQNSTDDSSVRTKIAIIKKRISKETENRQQKIFESYFDEVHTDFFKRLKEKHPQLSPKDLRLCAYIRMNISTKEIASLLNISDRGVEISRYRLRKKIELSREVNLSTFLSNI